MPRIMWARRSKPSAWSASMRNRFLFVAAAACGLIAAAVPLMAHHSFAAQYDRTKQATLTGPVTKVDWINPHARFLLNVTDPNGKVVSWEVELAAPAMLMRRGWSRNSLKVGEVVTINGSLAKDGSNMINASTVTLSNGTRVFAGSSGDTETPAQQDGK
jgi:Family of unknown function (DUF6152)